MSPPLATADLADVPLVQAESGGDFSLRAGRRPDGPDVVVGEFCAVVAFTMRSYREPADRSMIEAGAIDSVVDIVSLGSPTQVLRIDAPRVIAGVKGEVSGWVGSGMPAKIEDEVCDSHVSSSPLDDAVGISVGLAPTKRPLDAAIMLSAELFKKPTHRLTRTRPDELCFKWIAVGPPALVVARTPAARNSRPATIRNGAKGVRSFIHA